MKKILGLTLISTLLLGGTAVFADENLNESNTNSKGEINFDSGNLIPGEPEIPEEPGKPVHPELGGIKQAFPNFWFGNFTTENKNQEKGLVDGEKWGEKEIAKAFIQDSRGVEGSWALGLSMSAFSDNKDDFKHGKDNEITAPKSSEAPLDGEAIKLTVPETSIKNLAGTGDVENTAKEITINEAGTIGGKIATVEVKGSGEYLLDLSGVKLTVPGSRAVKMKAGDEQYTVLTWDLAPGNPEGSEAGYGLK